MRLPCLGDRCGDPHLPLVRPAHRSPPQQRPVPQGRPTARAGSHGRRAGGGPAGPGPGAPSEERLTGAPTLRRLRQDSWGPHIRPPQSSVLSSASPGRVLFHTHPSRGHNVTVTPAGSLLPASPLASAPRAAPHDLAKLRLRPCGAPARKRAVAPCRPHRWASDTQAQRQAHDSPWPCCRLRSLTRPSALCPLPILLPRSPEPRLSWPGTEPAGG